SWELRGYESTPFRYSRSRNLRWYYTPRNGSSELRRKAGKRRAARRTNASYICATTLLLAAGDSFPTQNHRIFGERELWGEHRALEREFFKPCKKCKRFPGTSSEGTCITVSLSATASALSAPPNHGVKNS